MSQSFDICHSWQKFACFCLSCPILPLAVCLGPLTQIGGNLTVASTTLLKNWLSNRLYPAALSPNVIGRPRKLNIVLQIRGLCKTSAQSTPSMKSTCLAHLYWKSCNTDCIRPMPIWPGLYDQYISSKCKGKEVATYILIEWHSTRNHWKSVMTTERCDYAMARNMQMKLLLQEVILLLSVSWHEKFTHYFHITWTVCLQKGSMTF